MLYYHRDLKGSVIATTLTGGRVGVKYRYGPYGELDRQEVVDATGDSELGFTGALRLGWTPRNQVGSLLPLGARVYHAELRPWVQPDTVDILRYTYAAGDPVNFVDPGGREPMSPQQRVDLSLKPGSPEGPSRPTSTNRCRSVQFRDRGLRVPRNRGPHRQGGPQDLRLRPSRE